MPPRALACWICEIIFSCQGSLGARHRTGMFSIDQGDRSVFHFAGRIALGMDVGNLLELQRAFVGNRHVDAASQIETVANIFQLECQLF